MTKQRSREELESALALCVEALEAVEWVPDPCDMGDPDYCPWCHATQFKPDTPHEDDCLRQRARIKGIFPANRFDDAGFLQLLADAIAAEKGEAV